MIDVLKDIAEELDIIDETLDDMADVVSEMEEQIEELENEIYGALDDYGFDGFGFEGDDLYEITCSECDNTISVDMSMLDNGSINCPNCGEKIEFDIDFIDDVDPLEEI
jgi:DNA-directed RNA polymerase subunit RPC12/RpoP